MRSPATHPSIAHVIMFDFNKTIYYFKFTMKKKNNLKIELLKFTS